MRRTHLACEDAPLVRKLCCRDVGSSAAVCRHCHRTLHIAERVARAWEKQNVAGPRPAAHTGTCARYVPRPQNVPSPLSHARVAQPQPVPTIIHPPQRRDVDAV
mmetsp:Transcript_30105/g.93125  ORF Transcript_30105/g.93125 Transcript_30105/m.93125 type:complete len:104 (+) Transcript_30105:474-785(+)